MQVFLIKKKLIDCFKNILKLTSDKDCSCILKTNDTSLEVQFSNSNDRSCTVVWEYKVEEYISLLNPTFSSNEIKDVTPDVIKHGVHFILALKIQELKEITCLHSGSDQLWTFKVNTNGSREIMVSNDELQYSSSSSFLLSFTNCTSDLGEKWIKLCPIDELDVVFGAHFDVSNTSYNKIIGSQSGLIIESCKENPLLSKLILTSTNGRIMLNSKITLNENIESISPNDVQTKVLLPKSLKKFCSTIEKSDLEKNVFFSINEKFLKFKILNSYISLSRSNSREMVSLRSLYENDLFTLETVVKKDTLIEIADICKTIRLNMKDFGEVEITGEAGSSELVLSCFKKQKMIKRKVKTKSILENSLSLKTGCDIVQALGVILSSLKLNKEDTVIIDLDPSIPYGRIKSQNLNTNVFFVLIK